MDTTNKVQVLDRDERSIKRTISGGVAEPMNPAHYPALATKSTPHAMSRFSGSFKELLLSDDAADNAEAKAHDLGLSPSIASLRTTGSGMNNTGASNASPKIAAGRAIKEVQEQSPAGDTTTKAAIDQVTRT